MAKASPKHTLDETLETIRTQVAELRQTEALEAQIHDMVMAKRSRVVGLMAEFLDLGAESAAPEPPPVAIEPRSVVAQVIAPVQAVAPTLAVAPAPAVSPPQEPPPPLVSPSMPLTTLAPAGAPRDLLHANGSGAPPTPSAQQVLDSLNRLMSGLKEISVKQGNAPIA